jgi:glycine dehydrogenase
MGNFATRHIGLKPSDIDLMLSTIGVDNIDDLISKTVPKSIFGGNKLELKEGMSEERVLARAQSLAAKNKLNINFLGQGYYGTHTPSVIKRNLLENPGWYTAYTPYQAEISQGRLEMLINFQQMIIDLTALDIANASLLDEASAAAEAVNMAYNFHRGKKTSFIVDNNLHPQTLSVLNTRASALGLNMIVATIDETTDFSDVFAVVSQVLNTNGAFVDYTKTNLKAQENEVVTIGCFDILALVLMQNAKEMNYDIALGSTQRFGVPLGFGGPHAAFIATLDKYKRLIPGRIIGVSKDKNDNIAYRMSMQTREQHIRRDKATSNICTAQVLLAVMAVSYAIYHGKDGLKNIAKSIYNKTHSLGDILQQNGSELISSNYFDTLSIKTNNAKQLWQKALDLGINIRLLSDDILTIALDETTSTHDINQLLNVFDIKYKFEMKDYDIKNELLRNDEILTHKVFNSYTSETEMMRYLKRLENKDITLSHSMIALGSCTMKLNAATQMITIANAGFANLHPYVPADQTKGYQELSNELCDYLTTITGYDAVSLQPNAGSQGEFAGLLAIKKYHKSLGEGQRNICLIPASAHGTNPASAVMVGMKVVIVKCDKNGNVDIDDLTIKANQYSDNLAAIMITYPSTHGVFEEEIKHICDIVHQNGAQVYLDGANLNAMVGLSRMGDFGADVSHLNLHKTFAIPHGGGGPGVGPIGVKQHLAEFLPGNPLEFDSGAVSAANFGSASILPISWAYIKLLGKNDLELATKMAILSANYIAKRLGSYYPILYTNHNNVVAHECIVDLREIKTKTGITEEDVAKRLMDYGFHAPTMSFPVAGTLMIEPTESESKVEIDRFITAMQSIYNEIKAVENGDASRENNVLKNAPHTAKETMNWQYPYSIKAALYPVKNLEYDKYFPPVKRIDNAYGDRNLFCSCPDIQEFS